MDALSNNSVEEVTTPPSNVTGEINSFYFYEVSCKNISKRGSEYKTNWARSIGFSTLLITEQFTLLWILFIAIVVGNTSVLAALVLTKARKSRMNFFIKHLAFADLLVGLISVLTDIIWHITVSWTAGNLACKVIRFLQAVVTYSSTYVLVALSVDRYDAIIHPMNFSGSWRRARILVACSWLLSILFSSPIIILYEERVIQGKLQCWIELTKLQWKIYMTLVALLLFVLPALIITACYTIIVYTIWTKSNMLSPSQHASTPLKNGDRAEDELRRASSRGIIPRAKIKTVKMTFVIVFVFILCWSPYIVFDLLQVYGFIPQTQTYIAVANFIQSLAPLNSAANPVIYCMFSTHLCMPLRKIPVLGWLCCGSVPPGGDSSTLTDTTSQRTAPSTRRVNTVQLHL